MILNTTSFWSTLEVECVCRDLSYEDYLHLHRKFNVPSEPLCRSAYRLLYRVVDMEMGNHL